MIKNQMLKNSEYGFYLDKIQVNMHFYLPRFGQIYMHIISYLYNNLDYVIIFGNVKPLVFSLDWCSFEIYNILNINWNCSRNVEYGIDWYL